MQDVFYKLDNVENNEDFVFLEIKRIGNLSLVIPYPLNEKHFFDPKENKNPHLNVGLRWYSVASLLPIEVPPILAISSPTPSAVPTDPATFEIPSIEFTEATTKPADATPVDGKNEII